MTGQGQRLVALSVFFLALCWLTVLLRCVVRARILKTFGLDDWLMVTALVLFTGAVALVIVGVHYGIGSHNADLSPEQIIQALKYQTLTELVYIVESTIVKISIAVFLLRIATTRPYIWALWFIAASCCIVCIVSFFFFLFQCHPVQAAWDRTPTSTCVPPTQTSTVAYTFSGLTIAADWLYALLPIPMIWRLQMTDQMKLSVALILSLGIVGSIANIVRLKYIVGLTHVDDVLFTLSDALIWTIVEGGLSISAASIATLRPLLRRLGISGFGKSSGNTDSLQHTSTQNARHRSQGTMSNLRSSTKTAMQSPASASHPSPRQRDDTSEDYILLEDNVSAKPS